MKDKVHSTHVKLLKLIKIILEKTFYIDFCSCITKNFFDNCMNMWHSTSDATYTRFIN